MNPQPGPLAAFCALSVVFIHQRLKTPKPPADNTDKACQLPLQDFHNRKIVFPKRRHEDVGDFFSDNYVL
jgi:hypothetical protein